jgi:uncharacterized pyridoxal phosphate-containing UPF0001 family protein
MPADVRWHFIGHLQSNKCSELLSNRFISSQSSRLPTCSGVPNIFAIQTVDSEKLAAKLNAACTRPSQAHILYLIYVLLYESLLPFKLVVKVLTSCLGERSGREDPLRVMVTTF